MNADYLIAHKRRKAAQDVSSFKALVADPTDLGSVVAEGSSDTIVLPANARVTLKFDADLPADAFTLDVNDSELQYANPALTAGAVFIIDRIERDRVIKVTRGVDSTTGILAIGVMDGYGRPLTFATVTFV